MKPIRQKYYCLRQASAMPEWIISISVGKCLSVSIKSLIYCILLPLFIFIYKLSNIVECKDISS